MNIKSTNNSGNKGDDEKWRKIRVLIRRNSIICSFTLRGPNLEFHPRSDSRIAKLGILSYYHETYITYFLSERIRSLRYDGSFLRAACILFTTVARFGGAIAGYAAAWNVFQFEVCFNGDSRFWISWGLSGGRLLGDEFEVVLVVSPFFQIGVQDKLNNSLEE